MEATDLWKLVCDRRVRRYDDLSRAQRRDFVGERLETLEAFVFRGHELAGREIEQRDAESHTVGADFEVGPYFEVGP